MSDQPDNQIQIGMYLPSPIAKRVYLITKTTNTLDAIKRLCDLGLVEYASMILSNMMSLGARGEVVLSTPFPPYEIPISCMCIDKRVNNEGSFYIFIKTMIPGEKETITTYCYTIEKHDKVYTLRGCSDLEYQFYGKKVKSVKSKTPISPIDAIASIKTGEQETEIDLSFLEEK